MRIFTNLALGLILAASSVSAQTGINQAPVPGPYLVTNPHQPAIPAFTPQRFAMPMPYWMQNTRQPQRQQALTPAPSQPGVGRTNQQPANTGWAAAPFGQGSGANPTPGFFPSYKSGQQQATPRQQPPAGNFGAPYPNNNFAPMPWTQFGGQQYGQPYGTQQGFMPMPWQNGQNGWGNNWNNNGNGSRQGYAAPNWPQQ